MLRVLAYCFSNKKIKNIINKDIERYLKWDNCKDYSIIKKLRCCLRLREFRSVFRYRIMQSNRVSKGLELISNWICPSYKSVEIYGEIQEGLYVSHSFCVIAPKNAGKNLRVGPGVVIGRLGHAFPSIGDNVYVAANATIIGNVKIGNNVIVGAGSVVTKDIPDNSVVVGNPAKIIRQISKEDIKEIM